jgi:hypothetical protein
VIGTGSTATQITSALAPAAVYSLSSARAVVHAAGEPGLHRRGARGSASGTGIANMRSVMSRVFSDGFSSAVVTSSPQMKLIESSAG